MIKRPTIFAVIRTLNSQWPDVCIKKERMRFTLTEMPQWVSKDGLRLFLENALKEYEAEYAEEKTEVLREKGFLPQRTNFKI